MKLRENNFMKIKNKLINLPAKNPTQNMFRRFVKTSLTEPTSEFKKLGDEFKNNVFMKNTWEE